MALLELEPEENRKYYVLPDGRVVIFEIEDDGTEIRVLTSLEKEIGSFRFENRPDEDDDEFIYSSNTKPWVKLMWMGLEGENLAYLHSGIGPMCLEVHSDKFGLPIYAARFDQADIGDGSHLVGDGRDFVTKMIKAGLLHDNNNDEDNEDNEDSDEEEYGDDE